MLPAVKIGVSRQIVIPKIFHDALRLSPGDYIEVERQGGKLLLTPKRLVEKHSDIERGIAEGLADMRAGRVSGPFRTARELKRHLDAVSL